MIFSLLEDLLIISLYQNFKVSIKTATVWNDSKDAFSPWALTMLSLPKFQIVSTSLFNKIERMLKQKLKPFARVLDRQV